MDNFIYLNADYLENLTDENDKYCNVAKEIAKDVTAKKLTILEVIQKLGYLLVSQSFSKREIGVLILSEMIKYIENRSLNAEQLSVLATYFSEKLKDHHQVAKSALKGVLAIINVPSVPSESVMQLTTSIFNHIICQQQQQQERYIIYTIYETVLNKYPKEVESMGIDFVYGVISSIDGERDPNNLIYLFGWLQTFLKNVKLGHLSEEMFEVLACYFPVDFKAPPNDKNKISREDLSQGLCQCLTSVAEFGQYGIPLALEKLESALKIAKEDSLDILKDGCKNYTTSTYLEHAVEIWSLLQKEIFNSTDGQLKQKCLDTLKIIINKLSCSDQQQFTSIINDITDNLKGNLVPDSKLFKQSSQILISVAQASPASSMLVSKKVAPLLENTFKITTNAYQKAILLKTYIFFVKSVLENNNNIDLNSIEEICNAPVLCSQAILETDDNLRLEGFKGFSEIVQFIPESIRKIFLNNFHQIIVIPQSTPMKESLCECLKKMSELFPQEVENIVLYHTTIFDISALHIYLEIISSLLAVPYFESYVVDTIINYSVNSIITSNVALNRLIELLENPNNLNMKNLLVQKCFITKLTEFLSSLENYIILDSYYLCNIGLVLNLVLQSQEASIQNEIYVSQSSKSYKNQLVYVAVLSGLIVPMKYSFQDYDKIDFLLDCSLNSADEFVRSISVEVLANILNKLKDEQILEDKLDLISRACSQCNNQPNNINVISWVTKSLVTRNHAKAWLWTDKLINLLDENIEAAKGISLILKEKRVLSNRNNCCVMPIYKQKFFVYVTNKINENSKNKNPAYYIAIGYLIEEAPKQAVIGEFKKNLRLLLLCLEKCTDGDVIRTIVQRISDFVASGESVIENNLEDILDRLLKLTTFEANMLVRIEVIKCLAQFTRSYQIFKLLPFKKKVIQQLGVCVDDKKRLVRKEAMECRSLWYLLDAPI